MPNPINITNIPAPRVEFIDPRTGLMAREWYRFFFNLFNLTGAGTNETSLSDLQVGPPPINDILGELGLLYDQAQLASMMAQFEEAARSAQNQLDTAPSLPQLGTLSSVNEDNVRMLGFSRFPSPAPASAPGVTYWDDGNGTLVLGLKGGNVEYLVGEQQYALCYNDTVSTMTKGQVVYISGAQGNRIAVKLAQADSDANSAHTIGFVAETIAAGAEGWVLTSGPIYKLNTFGYTAGDTVYLSPTTPGVWTTTRPSAPDHTVILGFIERVHASVGSIYVKVDNGYELDELHNVKITSVANNDLLQYDSAGPFWKNVQPSTITTGTATNLDGGVAGSLPYQTAINTTAFLAIGTSGQVLTSSGTAPQWSANTGSGSVVRATNPTLTTPRIAIVVGGTTTTSTLSLRPTSAAGTTGADIIFQVGNNGATEAGRVLNSGDIVVTGPGGLGYGTGSGGAVTQATSRTTDVTLNKTNGAITLVSAAGTTTWQSFTVTNSTVATTDTVIVNQKSGTDLYMIHVTNVGAGSFKITFATTGGTTTEQPVFNFAIIKAATS